MRLKYEPSSKSMSLKYEPSSELFCAGGDNELRVGLLRVRDGPQRRSARQGRRGALLPPRQQGTGPNPLYHRDDWVDRPRAMGV